MFQDETTSSRVNALRRIGFCVGWGCLFIFATIHARLPLGVLQIAGWTGMYVEYSKTFDSESTLRLIVSGEELCGICEAVENLRVAVNHLPELTISLDHIQLLPFSSSMVRITGAIERENVYRVFCDIGYCRKEIPQAPPPKMATV